jgi:hypothetical protein
MTTQTIDDQDRSHVTFVGNWVRGGSPKEYGETVASSTTVNDSFTVAFKGNLTLLLEIDVISCYDLFQEHRYPSMGHWTQHLAGL